MKCALRNGMGMVLTIMLLLGCFGARAQGEENTNAGKQAVESEVQADARESGAGREWDQEKPDAEAPDKGTTEEKYPEGEQDPLMEAMPGETQTQETRQEAGEPEEQAGDELPDNTEPEMALKEAVEHDEAFAETETSEGEDQAMIQTNEAQPESEHSIAIRRIMPEIIRCGDPFRLKATLVGFEDEEVTIRWQYLDGGAWTDVDDAMTKKPDALTLEVYADADNVNCDWRVLVSCL